GPAPAMQRQAQPGTPPNLAPPPLPAETEEERLNRMLSETAREEEARREITRADQPAPAPTVAPSETSLAEAVRRMLATCEAVQRQAAERREVVPPAAARERQAGQDPVAALKQRIEACLDTKEGQRVQAMAKELLLSRKGAPITVSAYLASILVTGRVPFIPSIPLGDELELSISVEGKVTQPAGGMVTLKFSGVPSWLESAAKAVGRGAATVGGAIWSGLKAVGGAVWSGLKTAGSAIWSGLKTVGGAIWSGVKAVGGAIATAAGAMWTGIRWVARQLWDKVTGIFARITQWIARLPERVGRLLLGLWEGVKSLKPWSLDWWASLGRATTWVNFLKWLGTRLIDLLEIAGVGEIYETVADFIKFNTRTLTDAEVRKASAVFGDSINYRLVRVDEAAVLGPAFSKREYTSFHTINGWGRMTDDILMHELTHVWQYEHAGAIYMPQAIHAQIWGAGYNYGGAAGLQAAKAAGQRITDFNREQQAQIVQDFSNMRQSDPDIALYASFVEQVSTLTAAQLIAGRPP
ncbi:MAG TPA: hypothetical protein DEP84_34165, partial [Chloroflexi bacterium]|nr:hypothetical protein [Chloroflexota bacterium]